jgi:hypothetical protein
MTYYERTAGTNGDGTPIFASAADRFGQAEVAELLARQWGCEVRLFGPLCPIDYYALRNGRLAAVIEYKGRSHAFAKHPTVFLNVRKWLALMLAETGLGVPAVFVVRFTDGLWWVRVARINASAVALGGCAGQVKSHTDVEPVIHVPTSVLRPLAGWSQ